jgi:hypothetical protein
MSEQDVRERLERLENLMVDFIESVALLIETTDTALKHLAGQVSHLALQLGANQDEGEEEQAYEDIQEDLQRYYEE